MTEHPRGVPGLDDALDRDIYDHCFGDTDSEVGGVLIGTLSPHGPPTVMASIRVSGAGTGMGSLSFTQDAWQRIHGIRDRRYPGYEIVGWYHSYPGFGVFLSDQDRFIHESLFTHGSQIAVVIDPVSQQEAVFHWSGKQVVEYLRRDCGDVEPLRADRASLVRPSLSLSRRRRTRDVPDRPGAPDSIGHSVRRPAGLIERDPRTGWPTPSAVVYLSVITVAVAVVLWALLLRDPTPFSFR